MAKQVLITKQGVRLIDVFVIAPITFYAGTNKSLPVWLRLSLLTIGAGTLFYNGINYLENR